MTEQRLESSEKLVISKDDALAGKMLGTMLSIFFMYTVITSIGVMWWTWNSFID